MDGTVAIIGAGAMGSAIAKGIIANGVVSAESVVLADVDQEKLDAAHRDLGVRVTTDNAEAVSKAKVVLIAVKPGVLAKAAAQIAKALPDDCLVISIAAGVKIAAIEKHLGRPVAVIRAMPNTPCQIGSGAVVYSRGTHATDKHSETAKSVFEAVGIALELPESMLDAVTGLSGSGPAYAYLFIEALSDAGVACGLPRPVALQLATQTVLGSAKMVAKTGAHPAILREQVTSPGGTTIAGLEVLERKAVRAAVIDAVKAAKKRSEELG
jgi:pyrroline-5-carboxylate reductase